MPIIVPVTVPVAVLLQELVPVSPLEHKLVPVPVLVLVFGLVLVSVFGHVLCQCSYSYSCLWLCQSLCLRL